MFEDAGVNLQIFCDYESRKIRVKNGTVVARGFHPIWQEVATFDTAKSWDESPYASRVTNEEVQQAITWFWIDMGEVNNLPTENSSV